MGKIAYGKKRVLAIVLALALVLTGIMPVPVIHASEGEAKGYKLVNMSFTEAKTLPYTDNSTGVEAVLQRDCQVTTGDATKSLNSNQWDNDETDRYWLVSFSTKNFENLSFNVSLRSSGTGPRDFKIQYSTDGENFIELSEIITLTSTFKGIEPIALPPASGDREKVYIRVLRASTKAVSLKDGEEQEVVSTGVSNINNIVVTGDSIDGTLPEVPEVPEIPVTSAPVASQPVEESPVPSEPTTSQPVVS